MYIHIYMYASVDVFSCTDRGDRCLFTVSVITVAPVVFPKRSFSKGAAEYETFRHSWILVERSRPVVPCAENTPLPNRKQSKHQRAKIFSVYLRAWTLVPEENSADVPYITDLDVSLAHIGSGGWSDIRDC